MNIKIFFICYIITTFFNDLGIPYMPSKSVPCCIIFIYLSLFCLLMYRQKVFVNDTIHIIKNKYNSLWIYVLFFVYILCLTIVQSLLGKTNPLPSIFGVILQYGISLFCCYIVSAYTSYKMFSEKYLIRLIYSVFYIILLLGLVDFFVYIFNIVPLQKCMALFFNVKQIMSNEAFVKAYSIGLPRVQSVYFEPGFFAEYTFFLLPIFYSLSLSKYKIFKNKYINSIIKKTTIPLIWIDLILTQSPIWLVLSGISTAIFFGIKFIINFRRNIKKYTVILLTSMTVCCLTIVPISTMNLKETYLGRIFTVVETMSNINLLIYSEQSLGTRISNVINLIDIGSRKTWFGYGHSNLVPQMEKQILSGKSPVAITDEMRRMMLKKIPSLQNPPLTNIFVRYGIIALFLYYAFILKSIFALKKCLKYVQGNMYNFIFGLQGTLISYIVISCYDILIANLLCATFIGLSIGIIQRIAKQYERIIK